VQWGSVLGAKFPTEMRDPPKRELQFELLTSPHLEYPLQRKGEMRRRGGGGVKREAEIVIGKEQSTVSWVGRKLAWGGN
jgi:hypothetical protein